MKHNTAWVLILTIAIFAGAALALPAQQVEFNYNGRVKVQGQAFHGTGYFKFTLISQNKQETYWANDGVTLDGSEPATSIEVPVDNGFFSVNIGDTQIPGMAPLDASLFNAKDRVLLRVWFSDGFGGFELLHPDSAVVNPALLGLQAFKEIRLYVNPATGNDDWTGLQASRPKKTIQAAWNALPTLIQTTATLHLAEGIYRETVRLSGKSVLGDTYIRILGNPSSPGSVRITGALAESDTTQHLPYGFVVEDQKRVILQGIRFDYFAHVAVWAKKQSSLELHHCEMLHNLIGMSIKESSLGIGRNLVVGNGLFSSVNHGSSTYGISVGNHSQFTLYDSVVHYVDSGLACWQGYLACHASQFSHCGIGVSVGYSSMGVFASPCTLNNNIIGVNARYNSVVQESSTNTYISNGTARQAIDGSYLHN